MIRVAGTQEDVMEVVEVVETPVEVEEEVVETPVEEMVEEVEEDHHLGEMAGVLQVTLFRPIAAADNFLNRVATRKSNVYICLQVVINTWVKFHPYKL